MNIYMSVPLDRKRSSIMCWKKKSPVSDEAEPQAENGKFGTTSFSFSFFPGAHLRISRVGN